jgi:putative transcriptional regulator
MSHRRFTSRRCWSWLANLSTRASDSSSTRIARGERVPSREFHIDALSIKELRSKIGLSQPKFAALLHVDVGTLRNWEQGRREPTGPAKALLAAIRKDPIHVLKALAA